jgi:hypothetical protein
VVEFWLQPATTRDNASSCVVNRIENGFIDGFLNFKPIWIKTSVSKSIASAPPQSLHDLIHRPLVALAHAKE